MATAVKTAPAAVAASRGRATVTWLGQPVELKFTLDTQLALCERRGFSGPEEAIQKLLADSQRTLRDFVQVALERALRASMPVEPEAVTDWMEEMDDAEGEAISAAVHYAITVANPTYRALLGAIARGQNLAAQSPSNP